MKWILLLLMLGASSLRAERNPAFVMNKYEDKPGPMEPNCLCQMMLVRLPTAAAKVLTDSPTDPWPLAVAKIASGEATVLAAPSISNKSDAMATCEEKVATVVIETTVKAPGTCDVWISFMSADLSYKTDRDAAHPRFEIGRGRVLKTTPMANDPTKSSVLLFRVLMPAKPE